MRRRGQGSLLFQLSSCPSQTWASGPVARYSHEWGIWGKGAGYRKVRSTEEDKKACWGDMKEGRGGKICAVWSLLTPADSKAAWGSWLEECWEGKMIWQDRDLMLPQHVSAVPEWKKHMIKIYFYVQKINPKLRFWWVQKCMIVIWIFNLYLHNKLKVWGLFHFLREVSFGDQGCIYLIKNTVKQQYCSILLQF